MQKYLDDAKTIEKTDLAQLNEQYKKAVKERASTYTLTRIFNEISCAEKERDLARNKAIHITLLAYGITPADASGNPEMLKGIAVTNDASKGLLRHWHAIAADNTKEHWGQGADGVLMNVPPADSRTMALTGSDGITTLFESAFESPAYLALILRHEREHFKQFVTPGKGDKLTDNERDKEAWAETLRILNDNELGLADKQNAKYKKIAQGSLGYYAGQAAKERRKMSWSLNLWKPKTSPYTLPHIQGDLADINKRAKELDEIFAEELVTVRGKTKALKAESLVLKEKRRRSRNPVSRPEDELDLESPAAVAQPAPPPVAAVRPAQPSPLISAAYAIIGFRTLAIRACESPALLAAADLESLDFSNTYLPDAEQEGANLSGCARRVFDQLVSMSRKGRPKSELAVDLIRSWTVEPSPMTRDEGGSNTKGGGGGCVVYQPPAKGWGSGGDRPCP